MAKWGMLQKYRKIHWTEHAQLKMKQYGLSKSKVLQLLRAPERTEQGIAENTMAVMQTNKLFSRSVAKRPAGEVWLMYTDQNDLRKIISAWRYPGISKPGENIPIPDEIKQELQANHGQSGI